MKKLTVLFITSLMLFSLELHAHNGYHGNSKYFKTKSLEIAARHNNTKMAKTLIDAGADVNATNRKGETPLMIAAGYGHAEIAKILIDAGADIRMYKHLGTYVNPPALGWAIRGCHTETIKVLIEGDLNGYGMLHSLDIFHEHYDSALMVAARYCHAETVKVLIDAGADVNARNECGYTAIDTVIATTTIYDSTASNYFDESKEEVIELLIEAGVGRSTPSHRLRAYKTGCYF